MDELPAQTPVEESESPIENKKEQFFRSGIVHKLSLGLFVVFLIFGGYFSFKLLPFFNNKEEIYIQEEKLETTKEVNALTVYHWWTSVSESAAMNSLLGVFTSKHPDVAIVAAPITGGAGFKMLSSIQALVQANQAPDAFQMHAGYEAQPFYDKGLLSPINYIWTIENLEVVIPAVIQNMCKYDGDYYSVPVNIHRSNLIWYNLRVLKKQGIDTKNIDSWESLFAAAKKLQAGGTKTPIQVGESWTVTHVLETMIASQGIDVYEDWINGKLVNADEPILIKAFELLDEYLDLANKDSNGLGWDVAVKRVVQGEGAFTLMGDWANGEFSILGMKYGQDYLAMVAPGTEDVYGLVVDTFQHPKGTVHPTNSDRWLKVVASKEGQDAFNPLKGSISPRIDSDSSKYDEYQQSAILDFRSAKYLYPSVVHGSGAPEMFRAGLGEIVEKFVIDRNVDLAVQKMVSNTKEASGEYKKSWNLKSN